MAAMPSAPGGSRTDTLQHTGNNIDKYLFQAMSDAGVAPAPPTTDFEFVRRVTLDLTGRTPTPDAVTILRERHHFDKRAKLVERCWLRPSGWTSGLSGSAIFFQNNSQQHADPALYPGRNRVQ